LAVHTEDLADGSHIYEAAPATLNPHHSAGRSQRLRGELRAIGFYISDWGGPGFTAVQFDALVSSGRITVVESHVAERRESGREDRQVPSHADVGLGEPLLRGAA